MLKNVNIEATGISDWQRIPQALAVFEPSCDLSTSERIRIVCLSGAHSQYAIGTQLIKGGNMRDSDAATIIQRLADELVAILSESVCLCARSHVSAASLYELQLEANALAIGASSLLLFGTLCSEQTSQSVTERKQILASVFTRVFNNFQQDAESVASSWLQMELSLTLVALIILLSLQTEPNSAQQPHSLSLREAASLILEQNTVALVRWSQPFHSGVQESQTTSTNQGLPPVAAALASLFLKPPENSQEELSNDCHQPWLQQTQPQLLRLCLEALEETSHPISSSSFSTPNHPVSSPLESLLVRSLWRSVVARRVISVPTVASLLITLASVSTEISSAVQQSIFEHMEGGTCVSNEHDLPTQTFLGRLLTIRILSSFGFEFPWKELINKTAASDPQVCFEVRTLIAALHTTAYHERLLAVEIPRLLPHHEHPHGPSVMPWLIPYDSSDTPLLSQAEHRSTSIESSDGNVVACELLALLKQEDIDQSDILSFLRRHSARRAAERMEQLGLNHENSLVQMPLDPTLLGECILRIGTGSISRTHCLLSLMDSTLQTLRTVRQSNSSLPEEGLIPWPTLFKNMLNFHQQTRVESTVIPALLRLLAQLTTAGLVSDPATVLNVIRPYAIGPATHAFELAVLTMARTFEENVEQALISVDLREPKNSLAYRSAVFAAVQRAGRFIQTLIHSLAKAVTESEEDPSSLDEVRTYTNLCCDLLDSFPLVLPAEAPIVLTDIREQLDVMKATLTAMSSDNASLRELLRLKAVQCWLERQSLSKTSSTEAAIVWLVSGVDLFLGKDRQKRAKAVMKLHSLLLDEHRENALPFSQSTLSHHSEEPSNANTVLLQALQENLVSGIGLW